MTVNISSYTVCRIDCGQCVCVCVCVYRGILNSIQHQFDKGLVERCLQYPLLAALHLQSQRT